jgi:hypothetical protein
MNADGTQMNADGTQMNADKAKEWTSPDFVDTGG